MLDLIWSNSGIMNTIGLILDIAGVWILFVFEVPFRGRGMMLTSPEMNEEDRLAEANRKKRTWWGVWLLTVGFSLQAISNFLK